MGVMYELLEVPENFPDGPTCVQNSSPIRNTYFRNKKTFVTAF